MFFAVTLIVMLTPYLWIVFASVHPAANISIQIPAHPTIRNYLKVFNGQILRWLFNSIIISLVTVVFSVSITGLGGYALSRMSFRGKGTLMYVILLCRVIPNTLLIVPLFSLLLMAGLINTFSGLTLIYIGLSIPLNLWIMKGSIDSIPFEMEEAAMLEGASSMKRFTSVIFPLMKPGIATVSMMSFMASWSQFLMPLIVISSKNKYPISVGLFTAFGSDPGVVDYSLLAAMSMIYLLPLVIFYFSVSNDLSKGLGSMGNMDK